MLLRSLRNAMCAVFAVLIAVATAAPGTASAEADLRFAFADLLTDNPEAAESFYGRLFGWTFRESANSTGDTAIVAQGEEIGLLVVIENLDTNAGEAQWVSIMRVADAAQTASVAAKAGGTVLDGPAPDENGGTYAVLRDNVGALLAVYSGGPTAAASRPENWIWFDLFTDDADAAEAFYAEVVGLRSQQKPTGSGISGRILGRDGVAFAGIVDVRPDSVKSAWLPYVGVADLEAVLNRATKLGGVIMARSDDAAIILDPTNAAIGVHELPGGGDQ